MKCVQNTYKKLISASLTFVSFLLGSKFDRFSASSALYASIVLDSGYKLIVPQLLQALGWRLARSTHLAKVLPEVGGLFSDGRSSSPVADSDESDSTASD